MSGASTRRPRRFRSSARGRGQGHPEESAEASGQPDLSGGQHGGYSDASAFFETNYAGQAEAANGGSAAGAGDGSTGNQVILPFLQVILA